MTAAHAEASRSPGSRGSRRSAFLHPLLLLLLGGLALRALLAFVILPASGFETDMGTYSYWANRLYELGPGRFYDPQVFADYPPAYLYLLWAGSHLMAFLHGGDTELVSVDALKLGPILADIGVAAVLYFVVRSWTRHRPDATRLGLVAAALYLFNPVTWYDSAVWGQTDAVGALVMLICIAALVRGNSEGATAMAVLAALVKPQFGVVVVPLVAVVLLRRHLLAPGSGPRHSILLPAALRGWFADEQGAWRLVSSAIVGLIVLLVLITPFSLDIPGFIVLMAKAAGGYQYLTVNAYNPWALVGTGGRAPLAFGGVWSPDTVPLLGPLSGVAIGAVLLAAGFAAGLLRVAWRDDRRSILIVAVLLALAFFILPTRVHERYLFPVFALLPLLAVLDRRWLAAMVLLSVASFINLHGILTTPLYATPNLEQLPLGESFRRPLAIVVSIVLHTLGFAFVAWQLRRSAASDADPLEALAPEPPEAEAEAEAEAKGAETGAEAEGGATRALRPLGPAGILGALQDSVGRLIAVVPLRRDRSTRLVGELGGGLGRMDLLLAVVVFVTALGLRTYRLEEPYSMHFDEVYHARTAVEFRQNWLYDVDHSIYEYTHPHMAKYLMAVGIELLGNNRVTSVSRLGDGTSPRGGTPDGAAPMVVNAVALEQRWSPSTAPGERNGDRLYVATSTDVRVYDLATRRQVATIAQPAAALAVDGEAHRLILAASDGTVWRLNTAGFDVLRTAPDTTLPVAEQMAVVVGLAGDVQRLAVTGDRLLVMSATGTMASLDRETGDETGRTTVAGLAGAVGVAAGDRVLADQSELGDSEEVAATLSRILGRDAVQVRTLLLQPHAGRISLAGFLADDERDEVQAAIDDGDLPGISVEEGSGLAVGSQDGILLLDAETLDELMSFDTLAPVTGLTLLTDGVDRPTVYAATGDTLQLLRLPAGEPPSLADRLTMPASVEDVVWNPATTMLHILGRTQDTAAPTVYVLEPRSNSVFADARLPFEPLALVLDAQPQRPALDRQDLLAIDAVGSMATVEVGNNAFAYRFPGVLAGALMALCIYLLARFLFERRSIAVICSLLVLADGMFFSNARIAMNDTYVALFIVAALTLFVPLWLGRWRGRLVVPAGLIGVGLLLGLALASKWVGAYALGAVLLLILLRSALGRLVALAGMIGLTALLGYIAVVPPTNAPNPQVNYPFLAIMIALTVALAVGSALRPIRWTREELRLIVLGPAVAGVVTLIAGFGLQLLAPAAPAASPITPAHLLTGGVALLGIALAAYGTAWLAGGFFAVGPLAPVLPALPGTEPASPPPPRGWLRPGSGPLGLSWLVALVALVAIPLGVYVLSFVPWIELGNRWTADFPAGNTGQLFLDLQRSMYDYHNELRATHAASSPWWAWPFDLKPVWFEQSDYAGTTAVIYNTGNLVTFWLAIPAVIWLAYQAWRRRSLPLAFVIVAMLCLWLPWARIDRVSFQYHIFTSLPFWFMALAYFLAELWHGPSARTWLLARAAAAGAIMGPAILWLLRLPLCGIARTEQVQPGTEVCGPLSRQLVLTDLMSLGVLLAIGGLLVACALLYAGLRSADLLAGNRALLLPLTFSAALAGVTMVLVGAGLPGPTVFEMQVRAEEPALVALLLLAIPAYIVLRARDPRRFVIGAMAAAGMWFVLFYPNFSGLPVPRALSQIHLGLLPTWNWGFQFGVNLDASNRAGLDLTGVGALGAVVTLLVVAAVYAARAWRAERAERAEQRVVGNLSEAS